VKPFEVIAPASVEEAIQALGHYGDSARVIAGGTALTLLMRQGIYRPQALINLNALSDLAGIRKAGDGGWSIGALTLHRDIEHDAQLGEQVPALVEMAHHVANPQVRNMGTIGGNLCHADPASDPPTVLVAAGASINIQGSGGSRSVGAEEFFVDLFETALDDGELITSVNVPDLSGQKTAYAKFPHPASRYAIVGVAVALSMDGGTCSSASVAVGGATVKAVKCAGAEAALAGSSLDDAALDAAAAAVKADIADWLAGDVAYPESYRQQMAGVYLKRAVKAAAG
jgi:carbon-monoxide dehydrogenase medium subunit